jgi:heptosyltransferase-1
MKRVLVLRLSALGDVIHTIPAVLALRAAREDVALSWVVEAPYRELVELVAGVEAIPVRMKKWAKAPFAFREEMRAAKSAMRGASESIDFQGLVKSAALGALSRAPVRSGFSSEAIREKAALLFTNRRIAVNPAQHVVDQNLALARGVIDAWAPAAANEVPRPRYDEFANATGLDALAGSIVLLPGAGKENKLWPVDRFRELARQIGERALVVWGPGERDRAEQLGARLAPPTNLRELAWILRNAALVIGGDTGPLHLADALGTRVVGLYGPTNPRRNGPYGQLDHCVDHFVTTKCMESISVEEVMNLVRRVAGE